MKVQNVKMIFIFLLVEKCFCVYYHQYTANLFMKKHFYVETEFHLMWIKTYGIFDNTVTSKEKNPKNKQHVTLTTEKLRL